MFYLCPTLTSNSNGFAVHSCNMMQKWPILPIFPSSNKWAAGSWKAPIWVWWPLILPWVPEALTHSSNNRKYTPAKWAWGLKWAKRTKIRYHSWVSLWWQIMGVSFPCKHWKQASFVFLSKQVFSCVQKFDHFHLAGSHGRSCTISVRHGLH